MIEFIFVFSAHSEESIAFSVLKDGSNLPASTSGAPWLSGFRTTLSDSSFSLFGVDPVSAARAIRTTGFFVGKPVATASPAARPFNLSKGLVDKVTELASEPPHGQRVYKD